MDLKTKALGLLTAIPTIGIIDVNWTDVSYAIGEILDLLVDVLTDLPTIIIMVVIAGIFITFGKFFRGLFDSIVRMIKIR